MLCLDLIDFYIHSLFAFESTMLKNQRHVLPIVPFFA